MPRIAALVETAHRRRTLMPSLMLLIGVVLTEPLPAQDFVWTGAGDNDEFTNGANWASMVAPMPSPGQVGFILVDPEEATSGMTDINDSYTAVSRILFGSAISNAFSVSGNGSFELTGNVIVESGDEVTFDVDLIIGDPAVTLDANSAPLIINDNIDMQMTSGAVLTTVGRNRIEIAGRILGDNDDALTHNPETSDAALVLSGNNIYSGGTTLSSGQLGIGHDGALGSGVLTIEEDTSLFASGDDRAIANSLLLNGDLQLADDGGTARALETGGLMLTDDRRVTVLGTSSLSIAGAIQEQGGVRKLTLEPGDGVIRLLGANTYSGGTIISGGDIVTGSATPFGSGLLTIDGDTELRLQSPLNLLNGLTLNDGLTVSSTSMTGHSLTAAGTIRNAGGGELVLEEDTGLITSGERLTLDAESGDITVRGPVTLGTMTEELLTTGSGRIEISGVIAGDADLRHQGTGLLLLSGANNYTGDTVLAGGTLGIGSDSALGDGTGRLVIPEDPTLFASGDNRTITNPVDLADDLMIADEDDMRRELTLAGPVTLFGNPTISILGKNSLSVTGAIGESGGPRLLTLDAAEGEIRLLSDNSYTGGTVIEGGRIVIGDQSAFGPGSITVTGATEVMLGMNGQPVSPLTLNNAFVLSDDLTLASPNSGQQLTLGGVVSGSGGLVFVLDGGMPGVTTLTRSNTFSGGTRLTQGTLIVGHNSALGTGPLELVAGGTLQATNGNRTLPNDIMLDEARLLTISGSSSLALNGVISGSGALTIAVDPGEMVALNGENTYTEATAVYSGTLVVDGSISSDSPVTVNNGAALGGTGRVGSTLIENGATIRPGNSIGTLTVDGQYTQAAGSVYEAEITNDTATAQRSDLIVVTGTAILDGGNVHVSGDSGEYCPGTTTDFDSHFTILTADGGVTGSFDSISDTDSGDLKFLTPVLTTPDASSVAFFLQLEQTFFESITETRNQAEVARALDAISAGQGGDLGKVILRLQARPTEAGKRAAFDQLSGELFGTLPGLGVQLASDKYRLLAQRMRPAAASASGTFLSASSSAETTADWPDETIVRGQSPVWTEHNTSTLDGWLSGFGQGATVNGDGNAGEFRYSFGGGSFGLFGNIDESTRGGLFASFGGFNVDASRNTHSIDATDYQFGLFLTHHRDSDYWLAAVSYGFATNETERQIQFGSINRTATADFYSHTPSGYLEYGLTGNWGGWALQPFAALTWAHFSREAFTETGADSLNLSVSHESTSSLQVLAGAVLSREFGLDNGTTLTPQLRAHWRHQFLDVASTTTSTFAAGPITVPGASFGDDTVYIGPGLFWHISPDANFFFSYDAQISESHVAHGGSGGFHYVW